MATNKNILRKDTAAGILIVAKNCGENKQDLYFIVDSKGFFKGEASKETWENNVGTERPIFEDGFGKRVSKMVEEVSKMNPKRNVDHEMVNDARMKLRIKKNSNQFRKWSDEINTLLSAQKNKNTPARQNR